MSKKEKHSSIGSSFDQFLAEEGILESTTSTAVKRVIALQIQQAMANSNLTKTAMAEKMSTSRAQLNRLLSPDNLGVTLDTIQRAATVLGKGLRIQLVSPSRRTKQLEKVAHRR